MFNPSPSNIGGRSIIIQDKFNHYRALKEAKSTIKMPRTTYEPKTRIRTPNRQQKYQNHEHIRNLINLNGKLEAMKTQKSRTKAADYMTNPPLFFRSQKEIRKVRNTKSRNLTRPISVRDISNSLPRLKQFNSSDLKKYADALVNLVMKYHVRTPEKLKEFHTAVIQTIPSEYPTNFQEIVQKIVEEIYQNMFGQ